jgi:hypothetical protein
MIRANGPIVFACFSLLFAGALPLTPGCAANALSEHAPLDLEERAQIDMEAGRYADAQAKLEAHLLKAPEAHTARSMLAAALAAQGGVALLDVLFEGQSSSASGEGEDGQVRALLDVLPVPTNANVARLVAANAQMGRIPASARTAAMKTQAGLFLLLESLLRLKALIGNPTALASLTESDAARITEIIAQAASATGGASGNPLGPTVAAVASALSQVPSATEKQKVSAYVARISQT